MTTVFKTTAGAERAVHATGDSGWSRSSVQPHLGGYVIVLWWGSTSAPNYARVYGPGRTVLAYGVDATERLLGLRD